jgi:hypothetical protein
MNEWVNPSDAWLRSVDAMISALPAAAMPPRRVYLDKACEIFCLVSAEDYDWVTQWRWGWRWDRWKKKRYATRTSWRDGRRCTVYMHKAVLERAGKVQPSEAYTISDHQDGESLNNRRGNLEWATVSMNRRNRRR